MSFPFMLFPFFLPQLPEKAGEHLTAFILENPSGHLYLVIKLGHLQDIQHRAGAARLGVHAADYRPVNPGLHNGPG